MPDTLQVVEQDRLGMAGFHTHGGYNLMVNMVIKVEAGIIREAIVRTNLD